MIYYIMIYFFKLDTEDEYDTDIGFLRILRCIITFNKQF